MGEVDVAKESVVGAAVGFMIEVEVEVD